LTLDKNMLQEDAVQALERQHWLQRFVPILMCPIVFQKRQRKKALATSKPDDLLSAGQMPAAVAMCTHPLMPRLLRQGSPDG